MMMRSLLLAAVGVCFAAPAYALTPDGWEYITTDDGVSVYKKEVEGSDIVAFRGVMYADLHIGKIISVFRDPKQRPHWVDRYANHTTYERTPWSETYWIHFGLPWPVSDRDYVLQSKAEVRPEKRTVITRIKSVERDEKPKDECCVRAVVYGTYYEFVALPGEERTKLMVEVHTEPKGSIPSWLVNLIQKSWPSKTLKGLVERAAEVDPKPVEKLADWHRPKGTKTSTTTASN